MTAPTRPRWARALALSFSASLACAAIIVVQACSTAPPAKGGSAAPAGVDTTAKPSERGVFFSSSKSLALPTVAPETAEVAPAVEPATDEPPREVFIPSSKSLLIPREVELEKLRELLEAPNDGP